MTIQQIDLPNGSYPSTTHSLAQCSQKKEVRLSDQGNLSEIETITFKLGPQKAFSFAHVSSLACGAEGINQML